MYKYHFVFVVLFLVFTAFKTDKPAYLIFDKDGKPEKYEKMMKAVNDADIVLFGELHDNPISHWLELEVTKDMFEAAGDKLILGAEMFETDNRLILSEYVEGKISSSRFEDEAKLWPNYKTDYKPLVEFARKEKIPFVATNVPRRYASLVNSDGLEGLDKLSDDAKTLLPPLPIAYDSTLNCYASMLKMEGMGSHVNANFPKAQALKDATMSNSILLNWKPGKKLLHYHGAYHSQNFESIYWYLKHYKPELKIVTIHSVTQKDISELEKDNTGQADFTICVDEDMTRTR